MHDAIQRVVDPFLHDLDSALGERYSAVLYGSGARDSFEPGRSDINLMLVLDEVGPDTLRSLAPAFAGWRKRAQREPPLLMSRPEWRQAADAFPIEVTDMRRSYVTLRGEDPVLDLVVERSDLRRALERELHGKLLRLRQGYVAAVGDATALGTLARVSLPTVLLLFRCVEELLGRPVAHDPMEVVVAVASSVGFQSEQVAYVARHGADAKFRCGVAEFESYLEAVERTARFVDQLQLGDHQ